MSRHAVAELPILAELDLQRRCTHMPRLGLRLLLHQRQVPKLPARGFLHLREVGPEKPRRCALGVVHLPQQLPQPLAPVRQLLAQKALQRRGRASTHIAVRLQEFLLWIREVDAHCKHLRPCVSAAFSVLDHLGNLGQLLVSRKLCILDNFKGALCQRHQPCRPPHNAADKVGVVILQNPFWDDAEAVRQQRLLCLLPVRSNGFLHRSLIGEELGGIFPELAGHQRHLGLQEEIPLAVCAEHKDGDEPLLL
mmetsp:Transcript_24393/g.57828  ORF Transcript_24393/g.57828 Transcript_24393/m.57828 type:complete len:251 (-) Transcript_24393:635-1387(-)